MNEIKLLQTDLKHLRIKIRNDSLMFERRRETQHGGETEGDSSFFYPF